MNVRTLAYCVAAIALGLMAGALVGWAKLSNRGAAPPEGPPLPGVEVAAADEAAVPLFAEMATPTTAPGDHGAGSAPTAAAAAAVVPQPVAAPAAVEAVTAVLIVPHGPGFYAELDLAAASVQVLPVYAGTMTHDGTVQPNAITRAVKVATLRGPVAQVELLHLGFVQQAQPSVAHIRTAEHVEGLVLLRVAKKGQPDAVVAVRPLAPPDAPTPNSEAPLP